jgi:LuxR family maltose regulon positive regulatory protein
MEQKNEAIDDLKYAVELAADGEWSRPFIEAGLEIKDLLIQLKDQNIRIDFIEQILSELTLKHELLAVESKMAKEKINQQRGFQPVTLTSREMDILGCVAQGLRNQEIAEKLHNSEETIKKHIYNMFQKMQVRNRLSLVSKAQELGLLNKPE